MTDSNKNNIAKTVKQLRKKTDLSQKKFVRLADTSNNTIFNIKIGKRNIPTIKMLKKISKILDISVEELFK